MALPNMAMIPSGYKPTKLYSVLPTETYGSELVTNGDFATDSNWNKGTGWTISGGSANCDGTQTSQTNFFQVGIVPINVNYKVTFTTTVSAGGVILAIGGSNAQPIVTSSGTYTFTDKATSGDPNLYLSGNADFIGSIDNVSAQEVLVGSADFDVLRATSATRVNQQGLIETPEFIESGDLVTNGDFSNGSTDWSLSGTTVVSNGAASFVDDGTNPNSGIEQNALVVGKQYKVTFDVSRYVSGQIQVTSSTSNDVNISNGVGTYTTYIKSASVNLRFKRNGAFPNYDFDIDNISVIQVERNNIPRLDYTDGTCPVLLTEPQSTNEVIYSEDLSNSYWTKSNASVVGGFESPSADSPLGAFKLIANAPNGTVFRQSNPIITSSDYTASFYLKRIKGVGQVTIRSVNNDIINITLTDEWQRYETTALSNSSTVFTQQVSLAVTGDEIMIFGAQMEQQSYATSYIPTSGSKVTRNQDLVNNAGTSATYNSTEGVLFVEVAGLIDGGENRNISINDGTSNNQVTIYLNLTAGKIDGLISSNNVDIYLNQTGYNQLDYNKIGLKYKNNDSALWINGVEVATNTTQNAPIGLSSISFTNGAGNGLFFGKTSQVQVFNTALSDFDLQNLTSNATAYATYETMRTSLNFNIQ